MATWAAGQALREHALLVQPDFTGPAARADDLAHHLRLKALFDRASHAFTRR